MKANILKSLHNVSRTLWENVNVIGSHVRVAMGGLNSQKSSILARDTFGSEDFPIIGTRSLIT